MADSRTELERWVELASEGLSSMEKWVTANPSSPAIPALTQIIATSRNQVAVLKRIVQQLLRLELQARVTRLQAEIDAITGEIGP